ncbi:MAG: hypothetical protein ACI86H_002227 [bacterium]|jgi:hypothetical protein
MNKENLKLIHGQKESLFFDPERITASNQLESEKIDIDQNFIEDSLIQVKEEELTEEQAKKQIVLHHQQLAKRQQSIFQLLKDVTEQKLRSIESKVDALEKQRGVILPIATGSDGKQWPKHLIFFCKLALVAAFLATTISVLSLGSFLASTSIFKDEMTARIAGAMLILPSLYLKIRREDLPEAARKSYSQKLWWVFGIAFSSFLIAVMVQKGFEQAFPSEFEKTIFSNQGIFGVQVSKVILSSIIFGSLLLTDLTATTGTFIYVWEKLDFYTGADLQPKLNPIYQKIDEELNQAFLDLRKEAQLSAKYEYLLNNINLVSHDLVTRSTNTFNQQLPKKK